MRRARHVRFGLVAASLLLAASVAGCGGDEPTPKPPDPPPDPTDELFAPGHVVEVSIELDPNDWDMLRMQTRDLLDILGGECLAQPFPSPFTYFSGTVTVDGETLGNVGVRKKGFLGSLSETKPSIKIKFDEFVMGAEMFGLSRITLNNSRQDPSFLHTCLTYSVFTDAGVATPRCNFAHVTVNGEDMGVYLNVESPDKEFLRRWFADDEGNLYEGTLSDFRPEWVNTFDKKTNEANLDRTDLDAVVAALEVPDAELVSSLSSVIDLDGYLTQWAAEVLTFHWDGYASNTNNFYVYGDPTSGVFHFIPWGPDGAFDDNPFASGLPVSVYATGYLPRRLYLADETRAMYLDKLRDLLDMVWDENAMLAEIDRMEALITPYVDPADQGPLAMAADAVRTVVSGRRGAILAEINAGDPAWTEPLREPPCFDVVGDINGSFDTTFDTVDTMDAFATGTGTLAGTLNGNAIVNTMVGSASGLDTTTNPAAPTVTMQVVALRLDGTLDVAILSIDPFLFFPGAVIPLDWGAGFGGMWNFDPGTGTVVPIAFFMNGSLQLAEASTAAGAPVSGTFQAEMVSF